VLYIWKCSFTRAHGSIPNRIRIEVREATAKKLAHFNGLLIEAAEDYLFADKNLKSARRFQLTMRPERDTVFES
jgi:hypothetical protein